MSRIEEALRRGAEEEAVTVKPVSLPRTADTFVSPWGLREGSGPHVVHSSGDEDRAEALEPLSEGELHGFKGFNTEWLAKLVVAPEPDAQFVEQFRQLAATLHQAQAAHNLRVVMITSADPSEGKSLTAINLALTLTESYGRRVLLIDTDLRRPSLESIARLPVGPGLIDTLRSTSDEKVPVYRVTSGLTVVPAGRPDPNPMNVLTSPRMQQIIHDASRRFDWVILDAPPLGPIADSGLLAPMTDGALLVVRAGRTHHAHVKRAIEAIGRERVLGIVFNGVDRMGPAGYHHYYRAYAPDETRRG